jgi:Xaa-Pro aminopeptidase
VVPPDPRDARGAALRAALDSEGLDGLIVSSLPNIRYLTGFTGSAGVAAVLKQGTVFVSDFRYRAQAQAEVGAYARVEITGGDAWERLVEVLREYAGVQRLGFESHILTVRQGEVAQERAGRWRLEATKDLVERLREQKSPDEVARIRDAARLAAAALEATLPTVRVGQSERDVAVVLESELRRRGSEWHPFPTIVASGERSALPHARTSDRVLRPGDWLLLDFGAQVDGYCADLTRSVVVGREADARQHTVYTLVWDAQRVAREQIRAGMTGRDADALARTLIEARGFGDAFGHSLGHGLGLEVHEGPRLSRSNDRPLPEHAVVTIEPGIYIEGWGGVRLEDDVYLGPAGPELLSDGRNEALRRVG